MVVYTGLLVERERSAYALFSHMETAKTRVFHGN